jgi:S-adenosylmethionine:tRNA ribosyltransferase-isomerase
MSSGLSTSDYDFHLPPELIAQSPLEQRDASRLMVVDRASGTIAHRRFSDLKDVVAPGEVLVVNRARVG